MCSLFRPPLISTLFPYTTLFRSGIRSLDGTHDDLVRDPRLAPAEPASIDPLDRTFGSCPVLPQRSWKQALRAPARSEEHTSELQSHSDLVCRLLLEKKNKKNN